MASLSLEDLQAWQSKKKNKQGNSGKVATVQTISKPAQERQQTVKAPQGNQAKRNWGQNRPLAQPQSAPQRAGGWSNNRPQQRMPFIPNYQAAAFGQNTNWQRRTEDRNAGNAAPPRFGQTNQYRPLRQGLNQYQNQLRSFIPQGLGQRYQQD